MRQESFVQGLEAIGLEMQAADTEYSYSKDAPNWAATLAAMEAAMEEGQESVRRQDAAQEGSLGSPAAAQPNWEAALEQAVTSVLLWAQTASKAPGAQLLLEQNRSLPYVMSLRAADSGLLSWSWHSALLWAGKAQMWYLPIIERDDDLPLQSTMHITWQYMCSLTDSLALSLSGTSSEDTQGTTVQYAMDIVKGHAALAHLAPALESAAALLKGIPSQQGEYHKRAWPVCCWNCRCRYLARHTSRQD